ncbi:trypsin-like serine peptidase [Wenjunlia tyrosinilytica]|uniref:Peptidase n=1 Tax=Wenjunlia tyrosinilytica TaxID=1544741 RepID=A0A917ZQ60_9ACTN|nr:trypsin-like serine protease [Wenjunlia tyrosinilytica]GGO87125.1 peptidase [Wenjunlia tyrosinilytica]
MQGHASTPKHTAADTVVSSSAGSAIDSQRAQDYWTPERMRQAIPASGPKAPKVNPGAISERVEKGAPTSYAGSAPVADAVSDSAADRAGGRAVRAKSVRSVGKVFFYNPSDKKNYVCSASAINSSSKLLVLTAGHCVHGGKGKKWMQKWIFVPKYYKGKEPYGRFSAKRLNTFSAWSTKTDFRYDVGFVTVYKQNGKTLVSRVGGNGISFNYPHKVSVRVYGYPAASPFDGRTQWLCKGTTQQENSAGRLKLPNCNLNGGSSGGPWFRKFSTTSMLGYANGVQSTLDYDKVGNESPYFGEAVRKLYNQVGNDT